jgi:hypothetical protein
MIFKKLSLKRVFDFLLSIADLKKNVFINLRKQIGQKMEGISAS